MANNIQKRHQTRNQTKRNNDDPLKVLREINCEEDEFYLDVKSKLAEFTNKKIVNPILVKQHKDD